MKYQLFYQQHMIATIEEDSADFPAFFGRYRLEPIVDISELAHLRAYIEFSVRVDPLRDQERFDDPAMSEQEAFTDLIDSPDWSLVETRTRRRIPLLIPMFCAESGVICRLNTSIKTDETARGEKKRS